MLRRLLALITLVLAVLVMALVGTARALTFGVHTPSDPFNGNTKKVDALQRDTGRRMGIVSWFQSWGAEPWVAEVQPHVFNAVINHGRLPLVTWEPWTPGGGSSQPRFALARIAGGAFDDYIARWARDLRGLRKRIYLRPMHEFNGNWYPWSGTVNGNSADLFKQAWIRMHDIFRSQGATNVKWVFSPMTEDWPIQPDNRMERYYPGRGYVDVLALDGYNWGASRPEFGGWRSFRKTFTRAYNRLKRLGNQPIWIAEVGCGVDGGSKAAWVRGMFRTAQRMKRLRAIVWMDTLDPSEGDWRIRSSSDTLAAFAAHRFRASASSTQSVQVLGGRRAGSRVVVRWTAMGAGARVRRWRVYLNGRRVRVVRAGQARVVRRRLRYAGHYRWTVRGVDAAGRTIVSGSRTLRIVRR